MAPGLLALASWPWPLGLCLLFLGVFPILSFYLWREQERKPNQRPVVQKPEDKEAGEGFCQIQAIGYAYSIGRQPRLF